MFESPTRSRRPEPADLAGLAALLQGVAELAEVGVVLDPVAIADLSAAISTTAQALAGLPPWRA